MIIPGNEKSVFAFVKGINLTEGTHVFLAQGKTVSYFDHSPIEEQISVPLVNVDDPSMRITKIVRMTDSQFSQALDILCALKHSRSGEKKKARKAVIELTEIHWPEDWELEEFEGTWGLVSTSSFV